VRPNYRYSMRVKFSRKIWDRWLERLSGPDEADPRYAYLKDGIADFRRLCAEREKGPL
jgi:hypothetical protein